MKKGTGTGLEVEGEWIRGFELNAAELGRITLQQMMIMAKFV